MKKFEPISISSYGSCSVLGSNEKDIFSNYNTPNHCFEIKNDNWVAAIPMSNEDLISSFQKKNIYYKKLDRSVLLALKSAEIALNSSHWATTDSIGVNIGSSRGATQLWEKYISDFNETGKIPIQTSPTTSLGNISSWVAHHLGIQGPAFSHSMTCSSSFYAILNACAWLNSGMIDKMLVGGSEAPLTAFTIEQFKNLHIYSQSTANYPCQAGNFNKNFNSMILGEGSAVFGLEQQTPKNQNSIKIKGIGYASEIISHPVSLSNTAENCQKAMKMALQEEMVDVIITHTPGTIQGDNAEFLAIQTIFKERMPLLTNNKWKIGHSFGASGVLSLEMAILMLKNQQFISLFDTENPKMKLHNILINTLGFGGNAVSILVGY